MADILVIDDDADVSDVLRETLELSGHTVRVAGNGRVGLQLQRQAPADLIITDMYMPEQDGIETLIELQRDFPDVPVIGMSGGGALVTMDALPMARRLGARQLLTKPFTAAEMRAAVNTALTGPAKEGATP
jgi:two-component system, chemotaxis family, chemotaxis protein CheY